MEAGRALAETMGAQLEVPPEGAPLEVRVEAADREALLVEWINELIFQVERTGKVFTHFEVRALSPHTVEARLFGRPLDEVKTQVKAATFHGLSIKERDGELSAKLVLDV